MRPSTCANCVDRPPVGLRGKYWLCEVCLDLGPSGLLGPTEDLPTPATGERRGRPRGGGGYRPTADEQDSLDRRRVPLYRTRFYR